MKLSALLCLFSACLANAAVTNVIRYPLGESGSLGAGNLPQDTSGNGYHLIAQINGAATTLVTSGLAAANSAAALHFNGLNQGFYGNPGNLAAATGTDNFGIELWVRTPNITQENYDFIFSLTGDTLPATGPAIHLANGRWSASIPGYDWIGGNPFAAGGGVPAVANQWTRAAVVRASGIFRLYVDGVAHPMTTAAAPQGMNGFHMSVNPGGATYFEGDIDEVRVFTFAPGAFNAATDLYQIPITDFSGHAVITEFSAANTGIEDQDGAKSDWIELHNPTNAHAQLSGWRLTDDPLLPAKWTFPATVIAPQQRLIVFASSKNRAISGSELHTNFQLDPDGEYLALARPDGTIVSTFTFPGQKTGASYGIGRRVEAEPVTAASGSKFKAMTDASLGLTWTQPGYNDSAWAGGDAAIGWDDSVDDGSGLRLQGYWKFESTGGTVALDSSGRGMSGTLTGGATFAAAGGGRTGQALDLGTGSGGSYVQWPQAASGAFDAITSENKFTLSVWVYGGANLPTQGYLFNMSNQADGGGDRQAFAHLPWTDQNIYFDTGGCCGGDTRMNKLEPDTTKWKGQWNHYVFLKNNEQKEIWQNGVLWHTAVNIAPISTIRSFFLGLAHAGRMDELAVWAGALSPAQIQSIYAGTLLPDQLNNYPGEIRQPVRSAMHGITSSAMLRVPFTLSSPPAWHELRLRMRYDDAFVAYLNGVEIARRNAPAAAAYNSLALVNRPKGNAFTVAEDIDVSQALPLLLTNGQPNVLAIHGINDSLTSPEFFIAPRLVAYRHLPGRHFQPSTPGAVNDAGYSDYILDTAFTVDRGFYDTPQTTTITCPTADTTLHYTLDGSNPGAGNPADHAVPAAAGQTPSVTLNIATTTVVRALASRADWMPTNTDTHTYLFPAAIQAQPAAPPGVPATWGVYGAYGPQVGQPMIADYAMDQRVVTGALPGHTVRDGLLALPAVCLSLPASELFDPLTGMYSNSPSVGSQWIKPASMEIIYPGGTRASLQAGAGLRIHGGLSRQHWHCPKHSFSLVFKDKYGAGKLDYNLFDDTAVRQWDELVLRASSTDSFAVEYVGAYEYPNDRATYLRDPWMKDSAAAMGQPASHSRYVNLFLNGLYWGQYNLAEACIEGWHEENFGGAKEEYDVVKDGNELESGSRTDWDAALTLAAAGFPDDAAFYRIQGRNADGTLNSALPVYLDMQNLIDYMILHIYATARDWPVHNWWGGRRRGPASQGFKFYPWDQEITNLNLAWIDTYSAGARFEEVNSAGTPAAFYDKLRLNPRFQRQFGDRVQAVCFNNGPLTPAACDARWKKRQAETDKSIVAESARWGDARQAAVYTREANWLPEMNWVANTWWAGNHPQALARFRRVALFPNIVAPALSQHGGDIAAGFQLTLTAPAGTIYFNTDGTEPIALNGTPGPTAQTYSTALALSTDTVVKARAKSGTSVSALTAATFLVAAPASALNLVISEINYHPAPGGYEFVELLNAGATSIDLSGVTLSHAVGYTVPAGTKLAPGERLIITEAGAIVPAGIRALGPWIGKLANSGETLALNDAQGVEILHVTWTDLAPWPASADGSGASLTLIRPQTRPAANDPANWRASVTAGGSPGTSDATTFTGAATADLDHDGLSALLEYAFGTSDAAPSGTPLTVTPGAGIVLVSVSLNLSADDIRMVPEMSTTLIAWQSSPAAILRLPDTSSVPGHAAAHWQLTPPPGAARIFLRLRAEPVP